MAPTPLGPAPRRVPNPPSTGDLNLDWFLRQISEAINATPPVVYISGNPSGQTANAGTIGVNVSASSATTQRVWVNTSGTTSSWRPLSY